MQIKNRLTYQFTIIVVSILFVLSVSIYYFSARYRQQEFSKRLSEKGITTARLLLQVEEVNSHLLNIIEENNLTSLFNESVTIYDVSGSIIYSSAKPSQLKITPDILQKLRDKGFIEISDNRFEMVGNIFQTKDHITCLIFTSALDIYGFNKLNRLAMILILGFLLSTIAVLVSGRIFASQALKPIADVISEVDSIGVANLDKRVQGDDTGDEIGKLANTFNRMLERLQFAFDTQKSFVANASHELRTPLTSVRGQFEVALLSDRGANEYKEVLNSGLEDIKNLIKLTNGLLNLAQTGMEQAPETKSKVRIDDLLWQSISDCRKNHPGQEIDFDFLKIPEDEKMMEVFGNEQLLKLGITNVIDNGCKYGGGKRLDVLLGVEEGGVLIEIRDRGIGISENDTKQIYEPFFRGGNARAFSGHGIGLSLTSRIIRLHRGDIEITSILNSGTTFRISLPNA